MRSPRHQRKLPELFVWAIYPDWVEILLWLAAPLAVTAVAMVWAAWAGRPRDSARTGERSQQRFARAMTSRRPHKPLMVAAQRRERPSGVAVRPSRRRDAGR